MISWTIQMFNKLQMSFRELICIITHFFPPQDSTMTSGNAKLLGVVILIIVFIDLTWTSSELQSVCEVNITWACRTMIWFHLTDRQYLPYSLVTHTRPTTDPKKLIKPISKELVDLESVWSLYGVVAEVLNMKHLKRKLKIIWWM